MEEKKSAEKELKLGIDNNATDKDIIENMNIPYKALDVKVLIKPLPVEKIKKRLTILDEEKNKGKGYGEELATKKVTRKVETDFRKGVVLNIGGRAAKLFADESWPVNIGDTVIFHKNVVNSSQFDLFKDSLLINAYDIVAKLAK